MSDPIIAIIMLGLFLFMVLLGFPIAFTLMAMGIIFGYYAYFDADRMWRGYERMMAKGDVDTLSQFTGWIEGLFNNRIFDLFINQTYSVMANEVLTAIPLFLFMGYIVERANIVGRLFSISVQAIVGVGTNGGVKGNRNKAWTAGFGGNPDEGN
jgi:TRAP-type mannitol/chloroaromatic compound transport system permease large subunit